MRVSFVISKNEMGVGIPKITQHVLNFSMRIYNPIILIS